MGEMSGLNLYQFVHNSGENWIDSDGRYALPWPIRLAPIEWPAAAGAGGVAAVGVGAAILGGGLGYLLANCVNGICSAPPTVPPLGPTYPGSGGGNAPPNTVIAAITQPTLIPPITALPIILATQSGAGSQIPIRGGPANGSAAADNGDGTGTIRQYGPDGNATTDYDFGHDHTGAGDPHGHDWNWNGSKPIRGPARPLGPGE